MTIRVVLAEDNLLVREGVRRLLETRRDTSIEVVAACGDLDTLLAAVDAHQPDVVVTDIRMPPTVYKVNACCSSAPANEESTNSGARFQAV